ALYDSQGALLAELQQGEDLHLPQRVEDVASWRIGEFRANQLIELPRDGHQPGHLLLVASSELPGAFYTGTLTASGVILALSVLLWLVVAQQIKRLVTQPILQLEALSRQVTRDEDYSLRAARGNRDEIGNLADAF